MTLNFSLTPKETCMALWVLILALLISVAVYKPTALDKVIEAGTVLKELIATANGK